MMNFDCLKQSSACESGEPLPNETKLSRRWGGGELGFAINNHLSTINFLSIAARDWLGLFVTAVQLPLLEHKLLPSKFEMKTIAVVGLLLVSFAVIRLQAQAPAGSEEEQQLLALVKQVQAEHKLIAENQAKLEVKAQELAETVRSARFMAARAGGLHIPKSP
jgi:hypothetical protein